VIQSSLNATREARTSSAAKIRLHWSREEMEVRRVLQAFGSIRRYATKGSMDAENVQRPIVAVWPPQEFISRLDTKSGVGRRCVEN